MDPVGLGKDVLVCSSQRSGIDAGHVSSMKSSMKFEFLAFEVVYVLVPTMAMDGWLIVSEVTCLVEAQERFLSGFCICGSGCSHVFWVGRWLYDPPNAVFYLDSNLFTA